MKHILIPTDFSECANAASEFALFIAEISNAKIEFLHLIQTPVDWVKLSLDKEQNYPDTLKQIGKAKLLLNEWARKAQMTGLNVSQALVFNQGTEEIFKQIDAHNCDFVIMGSQGSNGIQEVLLGSNAQHILRRSNVPVLIVKKTISQPISKMLFVSDFKDVSQKAFNIITHFADMLQAHVDLLFVNTPDEFKQSIETEKNMDNVLKHCNRDNACMKHIIHADTVEKGVIDFISKNGTDLIAICTHGKGGLLQLFKPSITETLANHIQLPVLSIKL